MNITVTKSGLTVTAPSLLALRHFYKQTLQRMDIEVLFISDIHVQYQLFFGLEVHTAPLTRHLVTVTCKSVIITL
jgi:hypothetical protein